MKFTGRRFKCIESEATDTCVGGIYKEVDHKEYADIIYDKQRHLVLYVYGANHVPSRPNVLWTGRSRFVEVIE